MNLLARLERAKWGSFEFWFRQEDTYIVPASTTVPSRPPMEYKVLNTLWVHQVTRNPDYSYDDPTAWTFKIKYPSPEFEGYFLAGLKLVNEELVGQTNYGYLFLTAKGFEYCKEHYKEFPPDKWWTELTVNDINYKTNLRKVLGEETGDDNNPPL